MHSNAPPPRSFAPGRRCVVAGLLMAGLLVGTVPFAQAAPPTLQVVYSQQDSVNLYPIQVLNLALRESGVPFEMRASPVHMSQSRALQQLAAGTDVNVIWSMTTTERERNLLPIRIPIDKGLLGWRVFLINKDRAADFTKIKALKDLRGLQAGQGHDWPDTEILRANGLTVQTGTTYDGMFNMLKARRFDYFPRSLIEVWGEQKAFGGQELEIERTLILHYPTAFYFFVNKKDHKLAQTLERGLNQAIANGRFDQLFQQTYGDLLSRANLAGRTRLTLHNPLLPLATPLERKALWMAP